MLSIGRLAKQAGMATGTLRYYEQLGLIRPAQRSPAGYRLYRIDAARRLRFIRRAQALGFSLEEVAELLALSDEPGAGARDVKRIAQEKMADIEARILDLERMKQGLAALAARCRGDGPATECPILAALNCDDG